MATTDFKSVAEYLAAQPKPAQTILKRVRTTIRKAMPGAEEVISYQIPAYKLNGAMVIFFAGWKEHYSLHPATEHVVKTLKTSLDRPEVRKGTIRFPLSEAVPEKLIARIAKLRAKEAAAWLKAKRPATKKRPAKKA